MDNNAGDTFSSWVVNHGSKTWSGSSDTIGTINTGGTSDTITVGPNGTGGSGIAPYTPGVGSTTTWDGSNSWIGPIDSPTEADYKAALKLLHDPEFDLGKVMLEMVARFLAWKRNDPEVFNDPVIQKSKE